MKITNKVLINPDTGKPYPFAQPVLDDDGIQIVDVVNGQTAARVEYRKYDLFEAILAGLRSGEGTRVADVENFLSVSDLIRAARDGKPVAEQTVDLAADLAKWVREQLRKNLPAAFGNRLFCGTILREIGELK